MKRDELFNEVKSWLEAEKLGFNPNPDDATFEGGMATTNGLVHVRLCCEESPAILQVVCAFPLKVPAEKAHEAAVFLHNLNANLRIGCFCFDPKPRTIIFRLTMPVRPEADLSRQFGEAFGTSLGTWDDYLPPLALLLSSTEAAMKAFSKFAPEDDSDISTSRMIPESRRVELN